MHGRIQRDSADVSSDTRQMGVASSPYQLGEMALVLVLAYHTLRVVQLYLTYTITKKRTRERKGSLGENQWIWDSCMEINNGRSTQRVCIGRVVSLGGVLLMWQS